MFAFIVITTPQGTIILWYLHENDKLSINVKSPIFQCVKSVPILSFCDLYFTMLGLNTDIFYQLLAVTAAENRIPNVSNLVKKN